jgi:hypothetical protein
MVELERGARPVVWNVFEVPHHPDSKGFRGFDRKRRVEPQAVLQAGVCRTKILT